MTDKLYPETPLHRRLSFYVLRTLFEGDTVVLSGVTLVYAVVLAAMASVSPEAIHITRVIDEDHYQFGTVILVVIALYQFVCHSWLQCPNKLKVILGFICFTAITSVSFLPYFVWSFSVTSEVAGNVVVTIVALLVATRSLQD